MIPPEDLLPNQADVLLEQPSEQVPFIVDRVMPFVDVHRDIQVVQSYLDKENWVVELVKQTPSTTSAPLAS